MAIYFDSEVKNEVKQEQHDSCCKTSRALPVGSKGCTCADLFQLRAAEKAAEDMDRCYKYAVTILKTLVPSCEPLSTLMGILSQIDNWCSGQKNWATEKEELLSQFNATFGKQKEYCDMCGYKIRDQIAG